MIMILLFAELPSPSNSRSLEPLRVSRILRRSLPGSVVMIGSEAGLASDMGDSDVKGRHLLLQVTALVGIQRLKTLFRDLTFLL